MSGAGESAPPSVKAVAWLRRLWQGLRQMTGDDAYERYLEHHRRHHDGEPLGRAEFFRRSQREKWEGVRRCC